MAMISHWCLLTPALLIVSAPCLLEKYLESHGDMCWTDLPLVETPSAPIVNYNNDNPYQTWITCLAQIEKILIFNFLTSFF